MEEGSDDRLRLLIADWDSVQWLVRAEQDRNALEEYKLSIVSETRTRRRREPGRRGDPEHDETPPASEPHPEYDPLPPT